jgi:hypothetical protein
MFFDILLKNWTKLFVIVLVLFAWGFLFSKIVKAQPVFRTANQATIAWDAPTTMEDGNALGAGDVLEYNIHLANFVTDPNKTNPTLVTPTPITATTHTITLGVEGKFIVGVSAHIVGTADEKWSGIAWSDDANAVSGGEFGLQYFIRVSFPTGLRQP